VRGKGGGVDGEGGGYVDGIGFDGMASKRSKQAESKIESCAPPPTPHPLLMR
jgi:hypothetical protein